VDTRLSKENRDTVFRFYKKIVDQKYNDSIKQRYFSGT
jgi:hypothetical protein